MIFRILQRLICLACLAAALQLIWAGCPAEILNLMGFVLREACSVCAPQVWVRELWHRDQLLWDGFKQGQVVVWECLQGRNDPISCAQVVLQWWAGTEPRWGEFPALSFESEPSLQEYQLWQLLSGWQGSKAITWNTNIFISLLHNHFFLRYPGWAVVLSFNKAH